MPGFGNKNKKTAVPAQSPVDSQPLPALPPARQVVPLAEQWASLESSRALSAPAGASSQAGDGWRASTDVDLLTPPTIPAMPLDRTPYAQDPFPLPASSPDARLRVLAGRMLSVDSRIPDILPHDGTESGRLNFQHHLLNLALKKLYLAPLDQVSDWDNEQRYLLDVGCGTGKWCQDMASLFPRAVVYGIDAFYPGRSSGQYLYREGNLLTGRGGVMPDLALATFDYIHLRDMALAIPGIDSAPVLLYLERLMKAGAWLEWAEFNIATSEYVSRDYSTLQPVRLLGEWASAAASTGRGLVTNLVTTLPASMQRANLLNIVQVEKPLPMGVDIARANPSYYEPHFGTQAKRIGKLTLANWMERMVALRPMILSLHLRDCAPEDFDQTLASVPAALATYAERGGNCYWPFVVVCGQKLGMVM